MLAEVEQHDQDNGSGFEPNSVLGTLIVAIGLCLICSLVVSTAAVALRPQQDANRQNKMRRNVLIAAGLWDASKHTDANIDELFKPIQVLLVNLPDPGSEAPSGSLINNDLEVATFNQRRAARDPAQSVVLPSDLDLAGIGRRENVAAAYLVKDAQGEIETIVLPIYGKGLWSTMYGFLALAGDGRTVKGVTFYEHGETPGLGGEIENPRWQAQWPDRVAVDESGAAILDITKPGYANSQSEIDGLSGATVTSQGVENMVRFWLGPAGFGPFLQQLASGQIDPDNR